MLAIGLTIGLFAYWGVIGCAVVRSLRTRMPPLQEMLLAPAVGVVLTVVPLFVLNRLGMPVSRFAYPLTVALLVATGVLSVLAWRPRPFADLPWRQYAPFAAVLVVALLLTGRPMLEYGLHWVSLCNDDMANYCIGATRFYHHGFYDVPPLSEMLSGVDYSHFYWFFYVPAMGRTGSELLIGWVMRVTGLTPHQAFMPLIMAFHLCQVSALGALVYRSDRFKTSGLVACLLLAGSPLASWGALYQLNSQVIGLALLAASAAALLRPYGTAAIDAAAGSGIADPGGGRLAAPERAPRGLLVRQGVLVGILMSGLFVLYPEVLPMLGLAWVIYVAIQLVRRKANPRAVLTIVAVAAATGTLLLWRHVLVVFVFVLGQATAGATSNDVQNVFYPYYLLPSGLADLWGFFPLTSVAREPIGSLAIVAGGLLLVGTFAMAVWLASREQPVGVLALVMILLGLFLFLQQASFGLYKLAMFIQPFLLGTVALGWLTLVAPPSAPVASSARRRISPEERRAIWRHHLGRYGPLILLALPALYVQQTYVHASRGRGKGAGFGELVDPSASKITDRFRRLLANHNVSDRHAAAGTAARAAAPPPPGGVVLDTYNIVLSKFQSVYTRGTDAAFPSAQIGTAIMGFDRSRSQAPAWALAVSEQLNRQILQSLPSHKFDLHDPARPRSFNRFTYRTIGPAIPRATEAPSGAPPPPPAPLFIGAGGKQNIFNRWHGRGRDAHFFAAPLNRVRDHLLFTESNLGYGYYLSTHDIAMYQLEPDPKFMIGTTMAATGRHLLFEVVNPSPSVRMVLDFTTSLRSDADNTLPPAAAVGDRRGAFPVTGRGSARVFSPPLTPQTIDGRSFVAIDMGQEAGPFPMRRQGAMRLYGRNVSLDWRQLVAFARDMSVVSERQYAAMKPPTRVQYFPKDLQDTRLEYSGVYEDGWVSDHAWLNLAQPWDASGIIIKGNVPDVGDKAFQTEMTISVDGEEVARKTLGLNWFEMTCPLPRSAKPQVAGRRRVEMRFGRLQRLPAPDARPVTFQIGNLGFESAPAAPVEVRNFPADLANPLLEPSGLDGDRWAAKKVSLRLTQPPDGSQLVVRGMVPKLGDATTAFSTTLRMLVDGKQVGEQALGLDQFEARADVPPPGTPGPRRVELEFSNVQQLPAPDTRAVSCQLISVGFEPASTAPSRVQQFPGDLRLPLLRVSGIFDDGWVGQVATLRLGQPEDADELTVRGTVPQIGDATGEPFRAEVVVLVDGQEVARQPVAPGEMELRVPVAPRGDAVDGRQVELRFSSTQTLPSGDGRQVGARLSFIGFTSLNEP